MVNQGGCVITHVLHLFEYGQRENRLRESLGTFITLYKARTVYLEVGDETKLFPVSAFGNSLCTSPCKPKAEKILFFPGLPCP